MILLLLDSTFWNNLFILPVSCYKGLLVQNKCWICSFPVLPWFPSQLHFAAQIQLQLYVFFSFQGENYRNGGKPKEFLTNALQCRWNLRSSTLHLISSPSGPLWRRKTRPVPLSVLWTDLWLTALNYSETYVLFSEHIFLFYFPAFVIVCNAN